MRSSESHVSSHHRLMALTITSILYHSGVEVTASSPKSIVHLTIHSGCFIVYAFDKCIVRSNQHTSTVQSGFTILNSSVFRPTDFCSLLNSWPFTVPSCCPYHNVILLWLCVCERERETFSNWLLSSSNVPLSLLNDFHTPINKRCGF